MEPIGGGAWRERRSKTEQGRNSVEVVHFFLTDDRDVKADKRIKQREMQSELTCPQCRHTHRSVALHRCSVPLHSPKSLP